jgi:hypothetical protein
VARAATHEGEQRQHPEPDTDYSNSASKTKH